MPSGESAPAPETEEAASSTEDSEAAGEESESEDSTAPATWKLTLEGSDVAEVRQLWLEMTPLRGTGEAFTTYFEDLVTAEESDEVVIDLPLTTEPAMLCRGARGFAIACQRHHGGRETVLGPTPEDELASELELVRGLRIEGRYLLGDLPAVATRVAVVPANLDAERPFTVPLAWTEDGFEREVTSDEEGRFAIPELAPGEYFLEAVLATGQVHRSEPFTLQELSFAQQAAAETPVFDLGNIEVAEGLSIEFQVVDQAGDPIAGAWVSARQGQQGPYLRTWQRQTDDNGKAMLSGFVVEQAVRLDCGADGHDSAGEDFDLLPVIFDCQLNALATVTGTVLGFDGEPPPEVTVSCNADERVAQSVSADAEGGFRLADLEPGNYQLTLAAPGFDSHHQALELAAGEQLVLEPIVLPPGRTMNGIVVDGESGEPVAEAEIEVVEPAGLGSALTAEDGTFSLTSAGESTAMTLRVSAAEHAPKRLEVSAAQQRQREPLRIALRAAGWLRAVVVSDGACDGCRLRLEPGGAELTTDALGEALSPPLHPGFYRVLRPRYEHLGSSVIEYGEAESRWVEVEAGEIKTVRFDDDQRRLVEVRFDPSLDGSWSLTARGKARSERVPARADGSFHIRQRAAEPLDLYLHRWQPEANAELTVLQGRLTPEARPLPSSRDRPLGEQKPRSATFRLSDGRVVGQLVSDDGSVVAAVPITLQTFPAGLMAAEAATRGDGGFEITNLPTGVYTLRIGERSLQAISISRGRTLDLGELRLWAGGF